MIIERLREVDSENPPTMEEIVDRLNQLIDMHNTLEELSAEYMKQRMIKNKDIN